MTSRDFCYWLQGFIELGRPTGFTPEQVAMIDKHLSMVFKFEIDPSFGSAQEALNLIHNGPTQSPRPAPEAPTVQKMC